MTAGSTASIRWRKAHPDAYRAVRAAYVARIKADPERMAALRERRRVYASRWRSEHRELARSLSRRWAAKHPEAGRARNERNKSAYYKANAESIKAKVAIYRVGHPEVQLTRWHNRRSREMSAAGSHTTAQWRAKIALHNGCCFYCGEQSPLTRDHAVPLSRGGSNDIRNILPACRPCNSRKGRKLVTEFLAVKTY